VNKEFDWTAFEKSLETSTAICAKGKADIKAAIAAGKGEKSTTDYPTCGLFRECHGQLRLVTEPKRGSFNVIDPMNSTVHWNGAAKDEIDEAKVDYGYTYLAPNLRDYLASGGKL
jgi:galactose-1-phosphate uridylyltransferase